MPAECGSHVASGDRLMEARRSLRNEGGGPDSRVRRPASYPSIAGRPEGLPARPAMKSIGVHKHRT